MKTPNLPQIGDIIPVTFKEAVINAKVSCVNFANRKVDAQIVEGRYDGQDVEIEFDKFESNEDE